MAMNSFSKLGEITVLFVGTDLLTQGAIPESFCMIASRQYRTIHLEQKCAKDYRLIDHLKELNRPEWLEACRSADLVIVQELGGAVGEDTMRAIEGIRALLTPDTPIYSLISELDYPKKLEATDNHYYIYGGYAHHLLVGGGILSYEQLHKADTPLPNKLYGYLVACVMYGTLFSVDCEMFSDDFLPPEEIPGESDRLKRETMRRIKRAAGMACEFSREHAMMLNV